jgi:hypothetical protein
VKISRKHHILPIFYLKGFTNDEGKLAVYDKESQVIGKDLHYPSTKFFAWNRNSVEMNGKLKDFPEKAYSLIDTHTSKILKKIQDTRGIPRLSTYEMQGLQFFVSDLFWRNPKNDLHYEETFKNTRFIKKFFSAIDAKTGERLAKDIPQDYLANEDFLMKAFKPLAGPLSFEQSQEDFTNWRICYNSTGNYICSDNPLLFANTPHPKDIFDSAFVFPLTKHHLLLRWVDGEPPAEFQGDILGLIQLALYLQAKRYCASSTKETLQLISHVPENYSVNFLKDQIFGFIKTYDQK